MTNKNIPTLRFPEFSGKWEVKKYGNIFSFRATNSFSRDYLNYEVGLIKNIHYGDIHTKFFTLFDTQNENVPFINPEVELKRIDEDNYCKEGDLIIADASEDYADVGKCIEIVNLNGEKVLAGLHTILARPDLYNMAIGFNGYLMKSENIRLQIKTIAQGSKVLSISAKRLAELNLTIPTLPEQTKIADFLSAVDKKLSLLKEKKSLLEAYKKGVMQKIFNLELRFKKDDGSDFEDWEEKRLGEVAEFYKGKGISKNDIFENGDIECIRYGELYTHYSEIINEIKSKTINNNVNDLVFSEANDVIIPASGESRIDIAKASCVIKSGVALGGDLNIIRGAFNGVFLSFCLNNKMKGEIAVLAQGISVVHLYASQLSTLIVNFPTLPEQEKIANFLSSIDAKIGLEVERINHLEGWKKGLLQGMFV